MIKRQNSSISGYLAFILLIATCIGAWSGSSLKVSALSDKGYIQGTECNSDTKLRSLIEDLTTIFISIQCPNSIMPIGNDAATDRLGSIRIQKNITISGIIGSDLDSCAKLTGRDKNPIFEISPGVTVKLYNLLLKNGSAGSTGGSVAKSETVG